MARKTRKTRKPSTKVDAVERIANQIAELIRKAEKDGTPLPWHKPWAYGKVEVDTETVTIRPNNGHYNGTSGRMYNGLNVWFLDATAAERGFGSQSWTTFKQAQKLASARLLKLGYEPERSKTDDDGNVVAGWGWTWTGDGEAPLGDEPCPGVRKGEKGTMVFYWSFFKSYRDRDGNIVRKPGKDRIARGDLIVKRVPSCRVYNVFNWDQCDCLPEPRNRQAKSMVVTLPRVKDPAALGIPTEIAEAYPQVASVWAHFSQATDCKLSNGGDRAFYRPSTHEIWMPTVAQFVAKDAEKGLVRYCSTLLHEMVHATSKPLDRQLGGRFGSGTYAFEELVAEIGAASLCHALGIQSELREDHASYVKSWVERIEEDKYSIHTAARMSREAMAWLLGDTDAEEDSVTAGMAA
jgi:antirestriction protein ArdC